MDFQENGPPLFKNGDINNPSNYRTIMVNPLMGKFFGSMTVGQKMREKGHVGFRPRHSTIDQCVTLRHLIEKLWDKQGETTNCFVDFKKAFDTVP
jgi:hypothetical protein